MVCTHHLHGRYACHLFSPYGEHRIYAFMHTSFFLCLYRLHFTTCTTLAQHLHNTCTTLAQHLHNTCTTLAQHLHNTFFLCLYRRHLITCTSLTHRRHIVISSFVLTACSSFVLTVRIPPVQN
jgi:hypothetical protein